MPDRLAGDPDGRERPRREGAPFRVALVGYGLAGRLFHGPLVSATPGLVVRTVVTGDPGRAAAARADLPGAAVVGRLDDLWARADEHDLVVVASPSGAHVEPALAALAHGLAVVVDKPLATTAADGRRVVDAARSAGRRLTVFHNRRWDSDQLTLRRLVEAGELGTFVVGEIDGQEDALRAGACPDELGFGVEPPERCGRRVAGEDVRAVPGEPGRWSAFYAAVVAALRGVAPPPVDPADALAGLAVLDAARVSATCGTVEVPTG